MNPLVYQRHRWAGWSNGRVSTRTLKRASRIRLTGIMLLAMGVMYGCGSVQTKKDAAPEQPIDISRIPEAVPKAEPLSRYGNPSSYEVFGKRYHTLNSSKGFVERGEASWYGKKFHGRRTSSGEAYDMYKMTAAHRSLPLPTYVEVYNPQNGRRATVKVNDRGPFHGGRIIDLSYAAALKLGVVRSGTAMVEIRAIDTDTLRSDAQQPEAQRPETQQPDAQQPRQSVVSADPLPQPGSTFVQIGAFGHRANAEGLRRRISPRIDKQIIIRPSGDYNNLLYRVQVGPLFGKGNNGSSPTHPVPNGTAKLPHHPQLATNR